VEEELAKNMEELNEVVSNGWVSWKHLFFQIYF
jgi:hypothetical protein